MKNTTLFALILLCVVTFFLLTIYTFEQYHISSTSTSISGKGNTVDVKFSYWHAFQSPFISNNTDNQTLQNDNNTIFIPSSTIFSSLPSSYNGTIPASAKLRKVKPLPVFTVVVDRDTFNSSFKVNSNISSSSSGNNNSSNNLNLKNVASALFSTTATAPTTNDCATSFPPTCDMYSYVRFWKKSFNKKGNRVYCS